MQFYEIKDSKEWLKKKTKTKTKQNKTKLVEQLLWLLVTYNFSIAVTLKSKSLQSKNFQNVRFDKMSYLSIKT